MSKSFFYSILLIFPGLATKAQDTASFEFSGQLSGYANYNFVNDLNFLAGGNAISRINYKVPFKNDLLLDFEASANAYGAVNFHPFDTAAERGNVEPYRGWARFSGNQFEVRAGLQKINFGSATSLRPLRWFDQVDPRDPLALTPGVWGLLGRYYFLNNANIWLWSLYGNEKPKGWDLTATHEQHPEFGGRIQYPVPAGQVALSYHHRTADATNILPDANGNAQIPENRIGLDGKWDVGVGLWFEASHTFKSENIGRFTNQTMINVGSDYTFGWGNGLNLVVEHLVSSFDEQGLQFTDPQNLTALTASYPIGLFDNLSTVLYYDWQQEGFYSFVNYQMGLKYFTLYFMVYLNPEGQGQIQNNDLVNSFNGQGVQVMLVYKF